MRPGDHVGKCRSHLRVDHRPKQSCLIDNGLILKITWCEPSLVIEHEEKFVTKKVVNLILTFARYTIFSKVASIVAANELNVDEASLV